MQTERRKKLRRCFLKKILAWIVSFFLRLKSKKGKKVRKLREFFGVFACLFTIFFGASAFAATSVDSTVGQNASGSTNVCGSIRVYESCATNFYLKANECHACPENSTSSGGAAAYCTCKTGYHTASGGTMVPTQGDSCIKDPTYSCSAGFYLPAGTTECKKCDGGYYCEGGEFPYNASSNQGIVQCPEGYRNGSAGANAIGKCVAKVSATMHIASQYGTATACGTGTYKAAHNVTYGATSSCSDCPTGYDDGVAASTESGCVMSVAAKKYVATANDSSASSCGKGTFKEAHTVNYGSTSSCDTCPEGYQDGDGAAAKTGCAMSVKGAKYVAEAYATSSSSCGTGTYKAAHTVTYGSTSSCDTCPSGYRTGSGADSKNNCSLSTSTGKYVKTAGAGQVGCTGGYCPGGTTVYYGGTGTTTGGISSCPSGYSSIADGKSSSAYCYLTTSSKKYVAETAGGQVDCLAGYACAGGTVVYYGTAGGATTGGIAQCTGATYAGTGASTCSECPTQSSGWTRGTGTGWTAYSDCYQTRTPANCESGTIKQVANGASSWGASEVTSALSANSKYYVNGAACSACGAGKYCTGGTNAPVPCAVGSYSTGTASSCTVCGAGKTTASTGTTAASSCTSCDIEGVASWAEPSWSANEVANLCAVSTCSENRYKSDGSCPTCSSKTGNKYTKSATGSTSINDCYLVTSASKYVATAGAGQVNCTGGFCPGDVTVYYGGTGTTTGGRTTCPTAYPYVDDGADKRTLCYSAERTRAWTGSQVEGDVPENCYSVTAWNSCSGSGCKYVVYSNAAGTGDGTLKSGCATNNASCTKTPKTVTAKSSYYVSGTSCLSCADNNANYTKSDDDNSGGTGACYLTTSKTNYVAEANKAQVTCAAGGWCPGNVTVYYGSTGGRTACSSLGTGYTNASTGQSANTSCYLPVADGYVRTGTTGTALTKCSAGTYKASHNENYGTSYSCSECTGRTKYSSAGAKECSTVSSGYYTTGCNSSDNKCTGQSQCTGATYCKSGVQNDCPAQSSGWTRNGGDGWTAVTSCNQTKSVGGYCTDGVLKQTGVEGGTWSTSQVVTALKAAKGAYVNGQTCSQCSAGTYQASDNSTATSCTSAAKGYFVASAGASAQVACVKGSYTSATGQSACTACGSGTTTSAAGQTSCNATCSNNNGNVKSWKSATWKTDNSGVTNLCTVNECQACSGATGVNCSMTAASTNACTATTTCKGGYYSIVNNGKYNATCSVVGDGYYSANTVNTRSACADLTGVSVSGGTYSTGTTTASANTACKYTAPTKTITGCTSVTTATVTYSGTAWPATTYTVSANAGYVISGSGTASATCTGCSGRTKYSAGGSATSCSTVTSGYYTTGCNTSNNLCTGETKCGGNAYYCVDGVRKDVSGGYYTTGGDANTRTGQSQCTGATYCSGGVQYDCPTNYTANTTAGKTAATECQISVSAKNYIKTAKDTTASACGTGKYNPAHTVNYGSTSGCNTCPANYREGAAASAQAGCALKVDAGTYVATAGAGQTACPANSYCVGGATIYYGTGTTTGGSATCASGTNSKYTLSAASSDDVGDCYLTTTAGKYVKTASAGETDCVAGNACAGGTKVFYTTAGGSTVTGGMTQCTGATYAGSGASACSDCPSIYTSNTTAGKTAATQCQVKTTAGQYIKTANDATQTRCDAGSYCPSTTVNYGSTGGITACPTPADHKRTTIPTEYYAASIDTTVIDSGGMGYSAITQCNARNGYISERGLLYEYVTYNETSQKYDVQGKVLWYQVNPGYYLTNKTQCGAYAYYGESKECLAGSYCPGKEKVACNSSNQSTVHTETFGLNTCDTNYPNSAVKSDADTDCYLTTTATKFVKTSKAAQVTCDAGGYCPGDVTVYYGSTGGRTQCTGATYAGSGASACSTCPSIYTSNTDAGKTAATQCQVKTTAGYYIATANDATQTECPGTDYCVSTTINYGSTGGNAACPDVNTYARTDHPAEYEVQSVSHSLNSWAKRKTAITSCMSENYYVSVRGRFYDDLWWNTTTNKYDILQYDTVRWFYANAGYYLSGDAGVVNSAAYYQDSVECPTGSYCPGVTNYTSEYIENRGLNACDTNYPNSAAKSDADTDCYLTTTATKFVKTSKAAQVTCDAGGYCPGDVTVYYGSTGGRTSCPVGTANPNTGASVVAACVACTPGHYADVTGLATCKNATPGYFVAGSGATAQIACVQGSYSTSEAVGCTACAGGKTNTGDGNATCASDCELGSNGGVWATPVWNTNNTVTGLCTLGTCTAGTYKDGNVCVVCADNKYSDAGASVCLACATGYGNSGQIAEAHAGVTSCKVTCAGGSYVPTAGGGCVNVEPGNWGVGGIVDETQTLERNSCPAGMTTIGYGAGADEVGDCGKILHVGDRKIYLRSERRENGPTLNVNINGTTYYGSMVESDGAGLKIKARGKTYAVQDDSMTL